MLDDFSSPGLLTILPQGFGVRGGNFLEKRHPDRALASPGKRTLSIIREKILIEQNFFLNGGGQKMTGVLVAD
jgi:hypothetical protein